MLRILLISTLIVQILSYNTNRGVVLVNSNDNCDYYQSPVFKVLPKFIQSRNGDIHQVKPVVVLENRIAKETAPFYDPQYETNQYALKFFSNIGPLSTTDLNIPEEEQKPRIDYNQLWKVGEIPSPTTATRDVVEALPDVYVKSEDVPPVILDDVTMEKSELTEEAQNMGDLEFGETFLSDPSTQMREVFIENITTRPESPQTENPAIQRLMQDERTIQKNNSNKNKQKNKNNIRKNEEGEQKKRKAEANATSGSVGKSSGKNDKKTSKSQQKSS